MKLVLFASSQNLAPWDIKQPNQNQQYNNNMWLFNKSACRGSPKCIEIDIGKYALDIEHSFGSASGGIPSTECRTSNPGQREPTISCIA